MISFISSQELCDGHCLSDEDVKTLRTSILELENADSLNQKTIENLNSQIYMYIQKNNNDSLLINLQNQKLDVLETRLDLYEDLVKEVKPKWYENKWIWFFGGIFVTTQSIKLAGELAD
tara:strand:- start:167 stop:523 length:357 start_codon:yes stop_codon:yes gene_type:complete